MVKEQINCDYYPLSRDSSRVEAELDKAGIEPRIRPLIKQLLEHGYETIASCQGHPPKKPAYILLKEGTGDGWFEEHAQHFGLAKVLGDGNCKQQYEEALRLFRHDPLRSPDRRRACHCGAGINGYVNYKGILRDEK